jgi:lambda family phage tail tape measure protein
MSEAKIVLTAVDQTKAALESAKRNIASIGDTVTRATSLMGPMAAGVLSVAGAVTMLSKALDTMDQLDEMSEKTGVSVEALSKLRFAGESVGTTTEQLGTGLKHLAKLMGEAAGGSDEAANVFKTMGVSFKDASGNLRSTDKVLEDMAERFSGWQDGPEKAALAMKALGKSGMDMIPVLNLGKQGLSDSADEAARLGVNLGGNAAKAAADFNDNMKKLGLTAEAASMSIMSQLLPSIMEISQELLAGIKNSDGFMDAILTMGTINPFKTQGENIRALSDELRELEKERAAYSTKIFATKTGADSIDADIAKTKKQLGYLKELQQLKALSGAGDTGDAVSRRFMRGTTKTAAPVVTKKDAAGSQSDFGANLVNQLTNQYANLTGQMTKVDEVQRMLKISGDKFTFAQKEQALAVAAQIDAFNHKKIANDAEEKGMRELITLQEQAELAYGRTILAMSDEARAMAFNTSLIGKTAEEVARLTFERELATKVAQAESMVMNDANNGLITQIEATERLAAVQRLASDTRAEFMAQQADQINQQYDAMRGVNDAVKEYQLSISKMGENTKGVMTNAFRGMEDALTNFVRTGKLDFKSLADSIISDMIRMQIQQSVTGPLSGILGKAIGSYFGGSAGADFGTGAAYGSQDMGTFFANGGVMSSGGPLPMNAYSNGGIADSPQLAIFGEGRMNEAYVPLPDGRTIPVTMSGGSGANVVVNVLPGSGQTADVKTSQDSQGNMTLDVVIRQIEDSMAGNMAAGSGSLFNATASRFVPQGAR